jgi:hypothetical protein
VRTLIAGGPSDEDARRRKQAALADKKNRETHQRLIGAQQAAMDGGKGGATADFVSYKSVADVPVPRVADLVGTGTGTDPASTRAPQTESKAPDAKLRAPAEMCECDSHTATDGCFEVNSTATPLLSTPFNAA